MTTKQKERLADLYAGIMVTSFPPLVPTLIRQGLFNINDFSMLAASAINLMVQEGTISQLEKRECAMHLILLFLEQTRATMSKDDINTMTSFMVSQTHILNEMRDISAFMRNIRPNDIPLSDNTLIKEKAKWTAGEPTLPNNIYIPTKVGNYGHITDTGRQSTLTTNDKLVGGLWAFSIFVLMLVVLGSLFKCADAL